MVQRYLTSMMTASEGAEGMTEVIVEYVGKLGMVTVTCYKENGETAYHVEHSNEAIPNSWWAKLRDAILHAQFLAGRY